MRSYVVIPEGTPVIRVAASNPHFAASKARKGKGELLPCDEVAVIPSTAFVESRRGALQAIPGQLAFDGETS
jgi:hypothetical protein